jgi:sec-independent protein translocase protein TatA
MFGGKLGVPELLIILGIALIFFGPSKLGDLGKGLGDAIRNFKGAVKEAELAVSGAPAADQKTTFAAQSSDQQTSR